MDAVREKFIALLDDGQIFKFVERAEDIEKRMNFYRNNLRTMIRHPTPNHWIKPPLTWCENYTRLQATPATVGAFFKQNPNLSCRPMKIVPTLISKYYEPESVGEMSKLPGLIDLIKSEVLQAMYYFTDIRIACEFLHPPLISDEQSVLKPILALEYYATDQVRTMRDAMLKLSNFWAEKANARITMYEHAQCEVIQYYSLNFEQDFAESTLLIVEALYSSYIGLFMRIEKDYEEIVRFKKLKALKTQDIHQFYQ